MTRHTAVDLPEQLDPPDRPMDQPAAPAWPPAIAASWGDEPVRAGGGSPGPAAIDPGRAYGLIRSASAPFRAGTRFKVVPDVRFFTTGGRLRAPAELLPGADDHDFDQYVDRLSGRTAGRGWLLSVTDPLVEDFQLWAAVRDQLAQLWHRVGWPALPVTAELAAGHDYLRTDGMRPPTEAAGLLWVLAGRVTVRLWRGTERPVAADPAATLTGVPGDLLYWPADFQVAEWFADRAITLRLSVSGSYRRAAALVKNVLVGTVQQAPDYASGEVPYLPYPPPGNRPGPLPAVDRIEAVGRRLAELWSGPELARELDHQWTAQRSAAGLIPAPPPRSESTLATEDRLRVTAAIEVTEDRRGWGVNGHFLPIAGASADRIRTALVPGAQTSVPAVCRIAGAEPGDPRVLALLRALHRVHALELVMPAEAAGS